MNVNEIKYMYEKLEDDINHRIEEFKNIWNNASEKELFAEIAFCVLTPQSKAKNAWKAITELKKNDLLFTGEAKDFVEILNIVRFKNRKAEYLVLLRELFTDKDGRIEVRKVLGDMSDIYIVREWLVKNIKGIGYKEAGHILRNIGFGEKVSILDRHILKNLNKLGIITEIPKSMTKKRYLEIENQMKEFSEAINVPFDALDMLLWYKETGEIFK